jgi:hypothetical protein
MVFLWFSRSFQLSTWFFPHQDWWRRAPAIRLPNNDTGAAAMDASVERVRVDTAWSSADVSGNATTNATANATSSGEGRGEGVWVRTWQTVLDTLW